MENPAGWNETKKLIARARGEGDNFKYAVFAELASAGKLKSDAKSELVMEAIAEAQRDAEEAVRVRLSGISLVSRIYNKLQDKGFLTGE